MTISQLPPRESQDRCSIRWKSMDRAQSLEVISKKVKPQINLILARERKLLRAPPQKDRKFHFYPLEIESNQVPNPSFRKIELIEVSSKPKQRHYISNLLLNFLVFLLVFHAVFTIKKSSKLLFFDLPEFHGGEGLISHERIPPQMLWHLFWDLRWYQSRKSKLPCG